MPIEALALFPGRSAEWQGAERALRELFGDGAAFAYSTDEAGALIADAQIVLAFALSASLAQRAARLRWVQALGSGTEAIAMPPGAVLTNAAGVNAVPVAEATMAMILASARGLPRLIRSQAAHEWAPRSSRLLRGAALGIVGTGHIARALAVRAKAFEMDVTGFTRAPRQIAGFDRVLAREMLRDCAGQLDFLVLATAVESDTRGMIDGGMLAALRPGATLVNVARGELVDEAALLAALIGGHIGAALDVFAAEPLGADSPLWDAPNLLITPHCAGRRAGYVAEVMEIFAHNLACFRAGRAGEMHNRVV